MLSKIEVEDYLHGIGSLMLDITTICGDDIETAVQLLITCFKSDHRLFLCGNGGSAAQAQHMAAELVPLGLPAISLTTDTSLLTALSNDTIFSSVFSQQVYALGQPGDVLLCISTSGKSANVRVAADRARMSGLHVIGLTGNGTSMFKGRDTTIRVPSSHTQHIQEAHMAILHIICQLVKEELKL